MSLSLTIAFFSAGSVLAPLSLSFLRWKEQSRKIRILFFLLLASLLSDLASFFLFKLAINSYAIVNSFLLFQFIACFLLLIQERLWTNPWHILVISSYVLLYLVDLFFIQTPWIFNTYSNSIGCLILILYTLYYFNVLLRSLPEIEIYKMPSFWIAVAILTYYSGNFLLFIVNNYLTLGLQGTHQIMWVLHNILNSAKNLIFAIALWQNYRSRK